MNCPHFEEKYFRYCKAMKKRIMIPSRSEKEEFCCEHYRECPYYQESLTAKPPICQEHEVKSEVRSQQSTVKSEGGLR